MERLSVIVATMAVELAVGHTVSGVASLIEKRRADAKTILLSKKAAAGRPWVLAEDQAAAALFAYLRAAEEGTARRNLEMLADCFSNQAQEPPFAPDEFRRNAAMLADLSREEIMVLAAFVREERAVDSATPQVERESRIWQRVLDTLTGEGQFFSDPADLSGTCAALQRTGLVTTLKRSGRTEMLYLSTPRFTRICRLVNFETDATDPQSQTVDTPPRPR